VIIDIHGHYTTAPTEHDRFRQAQLARLADASAPVPRTPSISDDALRDSVETKQLTLMRERGTDLMILSPKASAMGHHVDDQRTADVWARVNNDLIHRIVGLFPDQFAGAAQLPQTPSGDLTSAVAELHRCVEDLGFVAANVNPDPSGGYWTAKPLTDSYWFPLYEALVDLEVPMMIHVSEARNPAFHTLGAHYLNADTAAFMQLVQVDLFTRFPTLQMIIPHGGGAVPFHWGRFRGLAERLGRPDPSELLENVHFDTCVYQSAGVNLLLSVIGSDNVLFASELLGAVPGIVEPETGEYWDDTRRYVEAAEITDAQRCAVFEGNVRRVYPRLDARLKGAGR
jgi:4-oxalmesaconate hydratase